MNIWKLNEAQACDNFHMACHVSDRAVLQRYPKVMETIAVKARIFPQASFQRWFFFSSKTAWVEIMIICWFIQFIS